MSHTLKKKRAYVSTLKSLIVLTERVWEVYLLFGVGGRPSPTMLSVSIGGQKSRSDQQNPDQSCAECSHLLTAKKNKKQKLNLLNTNPGPNRTHMTHAEDVDHFNIVLLLKGETQ